MPGKSQGGLPPSNRPSKGLSWHLFINAKQFRLQNEIDFINLIQLIEDLMDQMIQAKYRKPVQTYWYSTEKRKENLPNSTMPSAKWKINLLKWKKVTGTEYRQCHRQNAHWHWGTGRRRRRRLAVARPPAVSQRAATTEQAAFSCVAVRAILFAAECSRGWSGYFAGWREGWKGGWCCALGMTQPFTHTHTHACNHARTRV